MFIACSSPHPLSKEVILDKIEYLESDGVFASNEIKIHRDIYYWSKYYGDFTSISREPYKMDTSYVYHLNLLFAFNNGVKHYALENHEEYRADSASVIAFNTKAYIRGCEGMKRVYEQILNKKGDVSKNESIEKFYLKLETNGNEEFAREFVMKNLKEHGLENILISYKSRDISNNP